MPSWLLGGRSGPKSLAKWIHRAKLVDARQPVLDIAFGPKHLGLKLATSSGDGSVRVYEAVDVMNLMHWPLVDEFVAAGSGMGNVSSLSWSQSQFGPPSLAVGSERRLQLWRYSDAQRKWIMAEPAGPEQALMELPINDVAWAPNLGRSYELIATASQDRAVRIWKVTQSLGREVFEKVFESRDHKSEVWHVEWNVTGTVLASSGDDAVVRLWVKDPFTGEWKTGGNIDAVE
jgi:nucleoporin SEH1